MPPARPQGPTLGRPQEEHALAALIQVGLGHSNAAGELRARIKGKVSIGDSVVIRDGGLFDGMVGVVVATGPGGYQLQAEGVDANVWWPARGIQPVNDIPTHDPTKVFTRFSLSRTVPITSDDIRI